MISISEFIHALKTNQLVYVSVSNYFVLISTTIYFILERSDYIYEKLYKKFGFDMICVAKLIIASFTCLLISLAKAFVINETILKIIIIAIIVVALLLIKNAKKLPIWEEKYK